MDMIHIQKLNSKIERERERVNNSRQNFKFRFFKPVAVLFCVGFLFLDFPLSTFAYPAYTANSDIVRVAPYGVDATSGLGNWGAGGTRDFVTIGHRYRVRQDGTINRIRIYTADKSDLISFKLKVWRKNGSNLYDLIGTSNELINDLVNGDYTTIDLTTPIVGVQEGDYIGYRITSINSNKFYALTGQTGVTTYKTTIVDTDPSATNYDWTLQTAYSGILLPIEIYMQAPQIVGIGDSIMSGGSANHVAYIVDAPTTNNPSTTILGHLKSLTGYLYQNLGKGSDTTTGISGRFTTDVINLKPKVVVMEGGVNDIAGAVAKSTFIANWTSMLAAAQADSGITTIIVLKILPWTNGTTAQMQTRDDWNASLATLAAGYSKAIVVDASSYVGQFRAGGDAGNLWDIKTAYNADGVHYNSAGHGQIAQAIADNLPKPSATFDNDFSTWNKGSVTANYNLIQTGNSANTNISQTATSGIEYSTDGTTWSDATKGTGGDALTGLTSTASPGTSHSFVWDSTTDLPNTEDSTVYLRVRPNDGTTSATDWVTSSAFGIDNNVPPTNIGIAYITIDSPTQLTVTADIPTDSGSGLASSPYWFTETTGNPGSSSSTDWQSSNTFTDSGLTSNVQYTYKVKVKDAAGNISDYSTTKAQTPMTIGGGSSYTPTVTTTTVAETTSNPEEIASSQAPRNDEGGTSTTTQPAQSAEATITQLKSQLIILITQLIQMLTEQVVLMR